MQWVRIAESGRSPTLIWMALLVGCSPHGSMVFRSQSYLNLDGSPRKSPSSVLTMFLRRSPTLIWMALLLFYIFTWSLMLLSQSYLNLDAVLLVIKALSEATRRVAVLP